MDYSLSGSSFHGIVQVRILEWIAISFSRGSSLPRDWTPVSALPVGSLPAELSGKPITTTCSMKTYLFSLSSVQFISVTQLCLTLCDPMNHSTPGLPVHHQLLELDQTQVHWVSDAMQPFHPLLSPSPPAFSLSQHQGLFKWVSSSHQVAKVLKLQLQHQSFQ